MRLEWYGWHFLELGKIITDNLAFVKTVELMGIRENAKVTDLSENGFMLSFLKNEINENVEIFCRRHCMRQERRKVSLCSRRL